mmetsp:Transcript_37595/g.125778  ORF Transcript_37595/g.125778 Transcript_37595/m.125778 type:complete len:245 (+) Transcript_37595:1406-2140(+)
MTTRSKACSGGRQESARSAAPVFVHSTTWLASSSCLTDRLCRSASSRRSVDISALRAARARLPSRRSWLRAADSSPLTSRTMAAPSETARRASSDAPSTEGSSLAGWPTRTTRSGLPPASPPSSRSAMLSTATFEAAEASTRSPRATACRISSTTAVVLPVPGGPWMRATGRLRSRANWTARRWPSFRPRLTSRSAGSGSVAPRAGPQLSAAPSSPSRSARQSGAEAGGSLPARSAESAASSRR